MARTSRDAGPSVYSVADPKRFAVSSKGTQVRDGLPYPHGASWDGEGVNFALFSANATKVEACLFDELGKEEVQRAAERPISKIACLCSFQFSSVRAIQVLAFTIRFQRTRRDEYSL